MLDLFFCFFNLYYDQNVTLLTRNSEFRVSTFIRWVDVISKNNKSGGQNDRLRSA